MNYYEHHLADYTQATAHLSMIEDAAYSRLLRWYYANEKPIPSDIKQAERLVRATSKQERDAVRSILNEFFTLHEDGWHQDRADREIARYQDKQRKASASANARWKKTETHSEGNANAYANASETHSEGNAPQAPDTRHQSKPVVLASDTANATPPSPSGELCARLRTLGIQGVNPSHPRLIALLEAGLREEELLNLAVEPRANGKGFAWLLATAEGRRRDAASVRPLPAKRATTEDVNRAVAQQWAPPELRGATA